MKKSHFSKEQIIGILKEHQAGLLAADLCRKHGISDAAFYEWRSKYGGMEVFAQEAAGAGDREREAEEDDILLVIFSDQSILNNGISRENSSA